MAVRRPVAILVAAVVIIAGLLSMRAVFAPAPLERLRRDGEVYRGSWFFPRGGPAVVGFRSEGPAELDLDGERIAVGRGLVTARVVKPPGVYKVTFRGPATARLLWRPPGRRGPLERVLPSSLSPEPPATARFGAVAGAARLDAAVLTGILAVLAAAALALWRPAFRRTTALAAAGILALALLARLSVVGAAGQTWDEDVYLSARRNQLVALLDGDVSPLSWQDNYEHPPVTRYFAGLGALWQDGFGVARALFAILGAASAALLVPIGRRTFGLRAGIVGGVVVALTPRLLAHDVVIGHEAPTVFLWSLGILAALRVGDVVGSRQAAVRRMAVVGVVLGLACATRFTNALLLPALVVTLAVVVPRERWRSLLLPGAATMVGSAALVFVGLWPRLWGAPWERLQASFHALLQGHFPELYLGGLGRTPAWHYFVVYALGTTPVAVLLAAAAGGLRAAHRRKRGGLVILAWLIVPFLISASPVRQDGVRYVLPALTALALFAGAGIDALASRLPRPRAAGPALIAAFTGYLLLVDVRVYPY